MATLAGRVIEVYSKRGIPGVMVSAGAASAVTDSQGRFTLTVPPGNYVLQTMHRDFQSFTGDMAVSQNISYSVGDIAVRQTRVRAL